MYIYVCMYLQVQESRIPNLENTEFIKIRCLIHK